MKKKRNNSEFFELLLLNNSDELKKWLISHGKSGKPTCPIMFVDKDEEDKKDECTSEAR